MFIHAEMDSDLHKLLISLLLHECLHHVPPADIYHKDCFLCFLNQERSYCSCSFGLGNILKGVMLL